MPNLRLLFLLSATLAWSFVAHGQSLGDVARQQRQKQAEKQASAPHKVVTDDDLPAHSSDPANNSTAASQNQSTVDGPPINSSANAEEVKANFVAAKKQIADFEAQLEKLRASVHYVEANRYSNGVEYNQYQQRKQQEVDRMQKQLDQARQKLQSMQEQARKAGFGSAVYDP